MQTRLFHGFRALFAGCFAAAMAAILLQNGACIALAVLLLCVWACAKWRLPYVTVWLFFGALLAVSSKLFHVAQDPRIGEVTDTLPGAKRFYSHGKGRLVHDVDGFRLECNAYGEPTTVVWHGYEIDGVHIEYDYKKRGDVLDISTYDESYWVYPEKRDVITKISLATDEIFRYWSERKKNG